MLKKIIMHLNLNKKNKEKKNIKGQDLTPNLKERPDAFGPARPSLHSSHLLFFKKVRQHVFHTIFLEGKKEEKEVDNKIRWLENQY